MLRFLIIILSFLYFNSSTGSTIALHYCMGEFVSFSLHGEKSSKCGKCGMENHSENLNCCKEVHISIDSNDQHLPGQLFQHYNMNFGLVTASYSTLNEPFIQLHARQKTRLSYPPLFHERAVFIMICSFLI